MVLVRELLKILKYEGISPKDLSQNNLGNTFLFLNKIGLAIYKNVQVLCKNVIKLFRGGYKLHRILNI